METASFQEYSQNHNTHKDVHKNQRIDGKQSNREEVEYCTHCNKSGHAYDGCFKHIGYLKRWLGKGKKGWKHRDHRDQNTTKGSPS